MENSIEVGRCTLSKRFNKFVRIVADSGEKENVLKSYAKTDRFLNRLGTIEGHHTPLFTRREFRNLEAGALTLEDGFNTNPRKISEVKSEASKSVSVKAEASPVPEEKKREVKPEKPLTVEEKAIRDWKESEAVQKEFGGDINSYVAYLKAEKAGKVKVCGGKTK